MQTTARTVSYTHLRTYRFCYLGSGRKLHRTVQQKIFFHYYISFLFARQVRQEAVRLTLGRVL